uniref:Uncharacterized protein n=1 Tax=Favella ehrenbergii TaxID=182087 RepID=A0A7S3I6J2_9SPIT
MCSLSIFCLEDRIESRLHARLIAAQTLQLNTVFQILVGETEHFHGLRVRDEATLDAQTLISDSLSHFVKSIDLGLLALLVASLFLVEVFKNFLASFLIALVRAARQRCNMATQRLLLLKLRLNIGTLRRPLALD